MLDYQYALDCIEKAHRVIESAVTVEHINGANQYVKLLKARFYSGKIENVYDIGTRVLELEERLNRLIISNKNVNC